MNYNYKKLKSIFINIFLLYFKIKNYLKKKNNFLHFFSGYKKKK